MDLLNERKEIDLNGVKISPELLDLLRMTQDKGNEYLDSHVAAVVEAICYVASNVTVMDDEHSEKIRITIIKELSLVREMLKKLERAVLISIFVLFEPEILSNIYELGDIYIY